MVSKTEKTAIDVVMKYERKEGRKPKDVHTQKKGWDVESGRRLIEVKGLGVGRRFDFSLETKLFRFNKSIKNRYYIYIVYNIGRRPKLKILSHKNIFKKGILTTYTKAWMEPKIVKQIGKDVKL